MFNFFQNKKNKCPIPEETRIWMEDAFIWLINQFGEEKIINVKLLLPIKEDFPMIFDGSEKVANDCLRIVSNQMDVSPNEILISFYDDRLLELEGGMGNIIFSQQYEEENYSAGLYNGKNPEGKFSILIESGQLREPDKLIATLAHEISHIKILGEGRLKENDEYLTDLVTVFFGLGVFTANASFKSYTHHDKWGYSKQGYFSQQEWGYALALFAYVRQEETNPYWVKYLTPNIQSDFKKSELFINNNKDKVLV